MKVLTNVALADDSLVLHGTVLAHHIEYARLLLLLQVAEDEVVRD